MIAPLEAENRKKASMITAGFAGLMILIMFLLKWELPVFEKPIQEPGIEVELNLPEEPQTFASGGGGGGNPVQPGFRRCMGVGRSPRLPGKIRDISLQNRRELRHVFHDALMPAGDRSHNQQRLRPRRDSIRQP